MFEFGVDAKYKGVEIVGQAFDYVKSFRIFLRHTKYYDYIKGYLNMNTILNYVK